MAKEKKQPTEKRRKPEVPLEIRAAETILKGGSYITRDGRVITIANVPRSYSEAIESGLNFYIGREEA